MCKHMTLLQRRNNGMGRHMTLSQRCTNVMCLQGVLCGRVQCCVEGCRVVYVLNHTTTHPNRKCRLYHMAKQHKYHQDIRAILIMVQWLCLPEVDKECSLCNRTVTDMCAHMYMQCPDLYNERNIICDKIVNLLPVEASVELFEMDDADITDILMGHKWSRLKYDNRIDFYNNFIPMLVTNFKHAFTSNYPWLLIH